MKLSRLGYSTVIPIRPRGKTSPVAIPPPRHPATPLSLEEPVNAAPDCFDAPGSPPASPTNVPACPDRPDPRRRPPARLLRLLGCLALAGALTGGLAACDAPAPPGGQAGQLFNMLNAYRTSHGVPALAPASDAMAKAQAHSQAMASSHSLFHSSLTQGITPGWFVLGENIGEGPSIDSIEAALIASSPHRANMLDRRFNQVGVGQSADGLLWITEDFVGR